MPELPYPFLIVAFCVSLTAIGGTILSFQSYWEKTYGEHWPYLVWNFMYGVSFIGSMAMTYAILWTLKKAMF